MTTLIKSLTFSVFFLMIAFISYGQKDNLLTSTVNEIAKHNIYETTNTVGYAGIVSKQYQRFELLTSLATEEQLTNLATSNKNAIVRLYALQALNRKKIDISSVLKLQFQNDNTIVETLDGGLGDKKSIHLLAMQELKIPISLSN